MRFLTGRLMILLLLLLAGRVGAETSEVIRAVWAEDAERLRAACEAEPATLDGHDVEGRTALIYALMSGQTDLVEILLEAGADPGLTSAQGGSPLSFAALHGGVDAVRMLVEAGAEPGPDPSGRGSPWKGAAFSGDVEVLKFLVESGGKAYDLAEWGVAEGPLLTCARYGHSAMAAYLLAQGAPVGRRDRWGRTPLFVAAEKGFLEIVDLLLGAGADAGARAYTNNQYKLMSPLEAAAYYGHSKVVDRLVAAGATDPGGAALRWANLRGHAVAYERLAALAGMPMPVQREVGEGRGGDGFSVFGFSEAEGGGAAKGGDEDGRGRALGAAMMKPRVTAPAARGREGGRKRLAVIGGAEVDEVVDLLTAELSVADVADLVERSELVRVAAEKGLVLDAGAAGQDIGRYGELLGADGMVFLREVTMHTRRFIEARTVDAGSGLVLDISYVPEDKEPAEVFAKTVGELVAKMGAEAGTPVALTLLGVRALGLSAEERGAERALGMALAHATARTPGLYLLQREQMAALVAERALGGGGEGQFWRAGFVVEGNLEVVDDGVKAVLSLAPAGGGERLQVEAVAGRYDYAGLAQKLAAGVVEAAGIDGVEVVAMDAEEEARWLEAEAYWNVQARAYRDAIEPGDAAYALGRRNGMVAKLRAAARLNLFLAEFEKYTARSSERLWNDEPPAELKVLGVEMLLESVQIVREHLRAHPKEAYDVLALRTKGFTIKDPMRAAAEGVLLAVASDVESQLRFGRELAESREGLLECYGILGENLPRLVRYAKSVLVNDVLEVEALASGVGEPFRERATEILGWDGGEAADDLRASFRTYLASMLLSDPADSYEVDLDRLVPVDFFRNRYPENCRWLGEALAALDGAGDRLVGNGILYQLAERPGEKRKYFEAGAQAEWERRRTVGRPGNWHFSRRFDDEVAWVFERALPMEAHYRKAYRPEALSGRVDPGLLLRERPTFEMRRRLIDYYTAYLVREDAEWVADQARSRADRAPNPKERFSEAGGRQFAALLRANSKAKAEDVTTLLQAYELEESLPEAVERHDRVVVADQFWDPYLHGGVPFIDGKTFWLDFVSSVWEQGRIWAVGQRGSGGEAFLFAIDPATLETETVRLSVEGLPQVTDVTSIGVGDAWIYLVVGSVRRDEVYVGRRGSGEFRLVSGVRPSYWAANRHSTVIDDCLYMVVDSLDVAGRFNDRRQRVSGLVGVHGFEEPEWLVSNRRKPAVSPLDGSENLVTEIHQVGAAKLLVNSRVRAPSGDTDGEKRAAFLDVRSGEWSPASLKDADRYYYANMGRVRGERFERDSTLGRGRQAVHTEVGERMLVFERDQEEPGRMKYYVGDDAHVTAVRFELPAVVAARPGSADPRMSAEAEGATDGLPVDLNRTRVMEVMAIVDGHVLITAAGRGVTRTWAPGFWSVPVSAFVPQAGGE